MREESIGQIARRRGGLARDEDAHLGEATDDDENSVEAAGTRELLDVVHRKGRPRPVCDGERLKKTMWLAPGCLVARAAHTRGNVVLDECLGLAPEKVSLNELYGLGAAWMTSRRMIVLHAQDAQLDSVVIGNCDALVEKEHTVSAETR